MLHLWVPLLAHVPTYVGGVENCFTPPRVHTTSQVFYVRGSGGLELHLNSNTDPFDIDGGEIIDVDAVFAQAYDQSTFSLYIGCGGCVASQDPIVIAPLQLSGYEPGEVEPFTQTAYRSVFAKAERKFNSSELDGCGEAHFTIRLLDRMNRTDGLPVVWGAVIGIGETFTFLELLEFPIYVLRNHGDTWNGLGWTWLVSFFVLAPLLMAATRYTVRCFGGELPALNISFGVVDGKLAGKDESYVREWFYELALLAFTGTMIEEFMHLVYAQSKAHWNYAFWVGLFGVILFANGLPIYQVLTSWTAIDYRPGINRCCGDGYWACSANPWWAPFEILFGFSYLLLFGAGFYVGPGAIMIAGILRCYELTSGSGPMRTRIQVPPADKPLDSQTELPRLFF